MPRLIDADALAKDMLFRCNQEIAKYKTMRRALGDVGRAAFDSIKNAPTIDAEPVRHGRWERMDEYCNHSKTFRCSVCKSDVEYSYFTRFCEYDYCPDCGARMDLEVQDDTD